MLGAGRLSLPVVGAAGDARIATYEGDFESYGVLAGPGRLTLAAAAPAAESAPPLYAYAGDFAGGLESGEGTARYASGLEYTGPFELGRPVLQPCAVTLRCVAGEAGEDGAEGPGEPGASPGRGEGGPFPPLPAPAAPMDLQAVAGGAVPVGLRVVLAFRGRAPGREGGREEPTAEGESAASADAEAPELVAGFESGRRFQIQLEPAAAPAKAQDAEADDGAGRRAIPLGPVVETRMGTAAVPEGSLVVPEGTEAGRYAITVVDVTPAPAPVGGGPGAFERAYAPVVPPPAEDFGHVTVAPAPAGDASGDAK